MWVDNNLTFSDEQDITDGDISTYSINLGAAKKIGAGKQMYAVIVVDTLAADLTSVEFQIVTDSVATMDDTVTVQITTGAIGYASLTAGRTPIIIPLGSAIGTEEQYLAIKYNTSDAGTITCTAFLAFEPMTNWGD